MQNFEQESGMSLKVQCHQPCVNDARGCVDYDPTIFHSLREQVKDFTKTINAHRVAHEEYDAIKVIIDKLNPEAQQELSYLLEAPLQNILDTDSQLPQPLQRHQPEVKP